MVRFLDESVASGRVASRAALVAEALERQMRRESAEQDAEVLRRRGAADDLDDLVAWTASSGVIED